MVQESPLLVPSMTPLRFVSRGGQRRRETGDMRRLHGHRNEECRMRAMGGWGELETTSAKSETSKTFFSYFLVSSVFKTEYSYDSSFDLCLQCHFRMKHISMFPKLFCFLKLIAR